MQLRCTSPQVMPAGPCKYRLPSAQAIEKARHQSSPKSSHTSGRTAIRSYRPLLDRAEPTSLLSLMLFSTASMLLPRRHILGGQHTSVPTVHRTKRTPNIKIASNCHTAMPASWARCPASSSSSSSISSTIGLSADADFCKRASATSMLDTLPAIAIRASCSKVGGGARGDGGSDGGGGVAQSTTVAAMHLSRHSHS